MLSSVTLVDVTPRRCDHYPHHNDIRLSLVIVSNSDLSPPPLVFIQRPLPDTGSETREVGAGEEEDRALFLVILFITFVSMWTWLCSWLLALSLVTGSRPRMESTCDTLANKIHLTKEEFNKAKELMRTCEEDVELNKVLLLEIMLSRGTDR